MKVLQTLAGLAAGLTGLALAGAASAQPVGETVYNTRCKGCHEGGVERAPNRADLAQRPAADIAHALTDGIMKPMAQGLSAEQIQAVAGYLTGGATPAAAPQRPTGVEMPQVAVRGPSNAVDPMCGGSAPPITQTPGDWASTGIDDASTRFQRKPGLSVADIPRLKVKWAYSMPGGGQATVVGGWLWITNRSGKMLALDAKTGCVRWKLDDVVSRTTPMVVRSSISPSGWATFVGQVNRVVRAFDAQTGKEIWKSAELESHTSSLLTGSPIVADDVLLVPISSIEEATSMNKAYACCAFRGSLAGLDLKTGKTLWKTFVISEPRKIIRSKEDGQQVGGPAGAAIWSAPSIDRKRGLVYVVTGDSYTDVDTKGADAVFAMEIKTGKIRWQHQVTEKDNFVMGCGRTSNTGNCPTPLGPDFDFGATPVLVPVAGGKQVLVAGQKSGIVYGFEPATGKRLWTTQVGVGSALGGVEWGIGADDKRVYVPISDLGAIFAEGRQLPDGVPQRNVAAKPGVYALDPATGKILWSAPAPKAPCTYASDKGQPSRCARAQSQAPAIIPGAVFEGGLDGWFRAYDSETGKIIWEHSTTAQTYDTLNGIKGQPGGGIDGMGPTVANGMVYVMSGNNGAARVGSNGVNVLLAYSVDGK